MRYLYLALLLALSSDFFSLIPPKLIGGVKPGDIGLILLLLGIGIMALKTKNLNVLATHYTTIVAALFFLIAIEVGWTSIQYGQSLIDGVIITRDYWYYLSFILILYLLDSLESVEKFLEVITWMAFILILLSIINYINPVIFHHKWAEGHGIRAGVKRAFIPGMDLLTISTIWQFCKWIETPGHQRLSGIKAALLFAAHVFRQSRGRLISVTMILMGLLLYKRQYKLLFAALIISTLGYTVVERTMKENIVGNVLTSSIENVSDSSGSWGYRVRSMSMDIDHFLNNLWIGSGIAALRPEEGKRFQSREEERLEELSAKADLGYSRWIKSFGMAGIFWLMALYYFLASRSIRAERSVHGHFKPVAMLAASYFCYVAVSAITLNHFMLPPRIFMISLCAAILIRLEKEYFYKP